jgi:hypothetical protein
LVVASYTHFQQVVVIINHLATYFVLSAELITRYTYTKIASILIQPGPSTPCRLELIMQPVLTPQKIQQQHASLWMHLQSTHVGLKGSQLPTHVESVTRLGGGGTGERPEKKRPRTDEKWAKGDRWR